MSETKEIVSAVSETEDITKDGELTDVDLDKVAGGMSGIQALLAVCQMKAIKANDQAMSGAD